MDTARTFSAGVEVGAVFLNLMQSVGIAQRAASAGDLSGMTKGIEGRVWQSATDLADGTLATVCDRAIDVVDPLSDPIVLTTANLSWIDRLVLGVFRGYAGANQRPGQASDASFDAAGAPVLFLGYTGLGGKDAGLTAPSAGNPPLPADGVSWAIQITTGLWLYVDPSDLALKLYNATGASIRTPLLWFFASGDTGKR